MEADAIPSQPVLDSMAPRIPTSTTSQEQVDRVAKEPGQGSVLMKEEGEHHNDWLMLRVTEAIKLDDSTEREVNVAVMKERRSCVPLRS